MGLLDTLCMNVPQGLTALNSADGVNTLVATVKVSFPVNSRKPD